MRHSGSSDHPDELCARGGGVSRLKVVNDVGRR